MLSTHAACFCLAGFLAAAQASPNETFEQLAIRYVDEFPALAPVSATLLGDHRFDSRLDEVSEAARQESLRFARRYLRELEAIDRERLSRANQVDHALLENQLRAEIWQLETLREWSWNPLIYTRLAGSSVYGLMARDFAPLPERLGHVADRLEQFPRLLKQVRQTLEADLVPRIHAEKAIEQNPGVSTILDKLVRPKLEALPADDRQRLLQAIETAKAAIREHQQWLESDLLPRAGGDFRLGKERYDRKLAFTLQTALTRDQIHDRAVRELQRAHEEMYRIAQRVYRQRYPYTEFPEEPPKPYRQAIIRAALEVAYAEIPQRDQIVDVARESLRAATAFVREKDLLTVPPDPVEIIVMPEFQRGVTLAYCDSPGPLAVAQKTFYAVAPLPASWTAKQVDSYLREYNIRSIHNLTIHEAMPGHFVQLAHSNRYPGKLRAVMSSGVFIEGWAVYIEQVMAEAGYMDHDPLMSLIVWKWYLRAIANAILDQAIHTDGISRDQAMRLMMEDTFQEEREAAGKWVRAQLTSTQLSTYFVGYLEHQDMRRAALAAWGAAFQLKEYHDRALSFGSPAVRFARALLLDEPIPVAPPSR